MKVPLSEEAAQAFAQRFVACCNRGDIEAVLGHFAEDCTFDSPLAEKYVGTTRLAGKAALRAYWQKASAEIKDVHFDVDLVAVAPSQRAVLIVYRMRLGGHQQYVSDRLIFNEEGLVVSGMGLYGPPAYPV